MKKYKTSIIVPVLSESFIYGVIKRLEAEFTKTNQDWEVVCVFDSGLEKSASELKLTHLPHVRPLFYPMKRFGKGFALCYGFNQSSGSRIFFWEGNFSISPKQLLLYLALMDVVDADIVIGSKRHPLSYVYYTPLRHLYSRVYQLLVKILFGLNVTDTQVGLKLYKRKVLNEVIPQIIIKNWGFDLEILVVAHTLGFKRIIEAPIEIKRHYTGKKVSFDYTSNLLKDTLAIFYRKYLLKYYRPTA